MALSPQRWKAVAIVAQGDLGAGLGIAIIPLHPTISPLGKTQRSDFSAIAALTNEYAEVTNEYAEMVFAIAEITNGCSEIISAIAEMVFAIAEMANAIAEITNGCSEMVSAIATVTNESSTQLRGAIALTHCPALLSSFQANS